MKFTAFQIAELIGATVERNPDAEIRTFAELKRNTRCAFFLANPKYTIYIPNEASAVIVSEDFVRKKS